MDPLSRELFHFSVIVFWPGFHPGAEKHRVANAWGSLALQEPALFDALMCAAIIHIQARIGDRIFKLARLRYYQRAIELLRMELSQSSCSLRVELIMAISFLQVDDRGGTTNDGPRASISVPFRSLQWLDDFSCQPFVEAHRDALTKMITGRGIDCLEVRGLSSLAQYFDIISSTINLTQPALPQSQQYRDAHKYETRPTASGHDDEFSIVYSNDLELIWTRLVVNFGLSHSYVDLILGLRTLSGLFDVCQSNPPGDINSSRLATHRNLIQYRLLSTIDETDPGDSWLCGRVTDLVRSTLLMFTICVTFPIACQATLKRLLKQMKTTIERLPGRF